MAGLASLALRVGLPTPMRSAGVPLARVPLAHVLWAPVLLAVILLAAGAGASLAQERVGVSGAVNPQATGTPPGGATRQLVVGQEVVFNERIATTAAGQTQLLFLDESSMTIGPNSDLTIDQFVYDPKSGTGKLAMSATRGLLRYVGGKLSKQDQGVTLRTSTATLAVRGGAFIAKVEPTGTTQFIFIFGNGLTITGLNGVTETVRRPGFQITVGGSGGPSPSPAGPVPPAQLAQLVQQLDGRAGGTGGASVIPTDTFVAGSGIGQTVSGNLAGSVQQALQNQLGTGSTLGSTMNGLQNQTIQQTIQQTNSNTDSSIVVEPPPQPPQLTTFTYGGRVKNTNNQGTARGFVDQSATNGDIAYSTGTLSFPTGSPQSGVFTGTFGNVGTLTFPLVPGSASFAQGNSSSLGNFTGTSFLSADNTFFYANIIPTSQPTQRLFVFGGTPVNAGFYQQTGSTRIFAFSVQPDAALQSFMPFLRTQAGGNLPNAAVSPLYIVAPPTSPIGDATTASAARTLQVNLAINGQGANQQSTIGVTTGTVGSVQSSGQPVIAGQLRGSSLQSASGTPVRVGSSVSSTVDGNGNSFYGGNTISGFVLDQTAYDSVAGSGVLTTPIIPSTAVEVPLSGTATTYGFAQPALPTAVPNGVGVNRTTRAMTGSFGGLMYTTAQANPYTVAGSAVVNTDAQTNRVQATLAGNAQSPSAGVSGLTMQYGGLASNAGGLQAFVDNNIFAALESQVTPQQITINGTASQPTGQLYLTSSGAAGTPTSLLPSGVSYCQCEHLQWGYWGGDLITGNPENASTPRIDRGHINTWVAGVPTSLSDLNSLQGVSATASYTGHAIGSVFNNGASYVAAGGFNGTYNFGTKSAVMNVTNFDGRSFSATATAPLTGPNYAFSSPSPFGTTSINGTFYGPAAAETGGNFAFQSATGLPTYLASGIYAGKKP